MCYTEPANGGLCYLHKLFLGIMGTRNRSVTYICNHMVTSTQINPSLARRDPFQAIADPHRRAIISLLAEKRYTLNEVASKFTISRPAISKHVKILNECGLVEFIDQGRERFCVLKAEPLSEVSGWIDQYRKFWEDRLDALEIYLAELQAKAPEQTVVKKPAPRKGKKK
jgi:DNA-binding transcriptional ArsR family regulator